MPVDPMTVSRAARARAMRVHKIATQARAQEMLPNEDAANQHGRPQARRSAASIGVGDNLREALDDLYTRDQPKAPAWTSDMSLDPVTGDGDIAPENAVANVPMYTPGERHLLGQNIADAADFASLTSEMVAAAGGLAAETHKG